MTILSALNIINSLSENLIHFKYNDINKLMHSLFVIVILNSQKQRKYVTELQNFLFSLN